MNRRQLLSTLAATSALAMVPTLARATDGSIDLKATTRTIEVNGRAAKVFGLLQPNGTHGVSLDPGRSFDVTLGNDLGADTLIHWHGLTPPWRYDGVPDMPAPLLKAGEHRHYHFKAGAPGTHWMHAHTLQEQALLAAPLIVHGKDDLARDEQEHVVLLHDFSFTPAEELLARLKSQSGMGHGMNMGSGMMMDMDINDIDYDAYLANDRTLDDPEVVKVERGGRVRLRIINGATATAFTIDVGGLDAAVIAVDGNEVMPLKVSQFPLTMGQRVDLRIEIPKEGGAFPVLALREGAPERTGLILATADAPFAKLATASEAKAPLLTIGSEMSLRAVAPLAEREPDHRFPVMLTGGMMGYEWGMEPASGLIVSKGSRVAIDMMNHSMMAHPMHLHGHHFQVTSLNGIKFRGAVRDTVLVPPMARVGFEFDAVNPGRGWAFHCHNLYHMASGMMATIAYEGA